MLSPEPASPGCLRLSRLRAMLRSTPLRKPRLRFDDAVATACETAAWSGVRMCMSSNVPMRSAARSAALVRSSCATSCSSAKSSDRVLRSTPYVISVASRASRGSSAALLSVDESARSAKAPSLAQRSSTLCATPRAESSSALLSRAHTRSSRPRRTAAASAGGGMTFGDRRGR